MVSGRPPDYLFGQSAGEAERLRLQARMFAPYTARFLQDAGISPGMKVLDVGTGAGDVALLAADGEGPSPGAGTTGSPASWPGRPGRPNWLLHRERLAAMVPTDGRAAAFSVQGYAPPRFG